MKHVAAVSTALLLSACATTPSHLPTQANVDLNAYAGVWHEQARLPNRFQRDCVGDVQAEYTVKAEGVLQVVNQCRTQDGGTKAAEGEGRLSPAAEPRDPAKLEVRFAPKWTSWLPMVWGDYWIIRLAENDQYSLVGTPDRKYLWVLSREVEADQQVVSELLAYAGTLGFKVDEVIRSGSNP